MFSTGTKLVFVILFINLSEQFRVVLEIVLFAVLVLVRTTLLRGVALSYESVLSHIAAHTVKTCDKDV